jgi:hypothetical protein
VLVVHGGLTLILCVYIYCALIKLTHSLPLLTHSLAPRSLNIQQLTVQCITLYSYMDGLFQYFSFFNIFFISPAFWISLILTH